MLHLKKVLLNRIISAAISCVGSYYINNYIERNENFIKNAVICSIFALLLIIAIQIILPANNKRDKLK